MNGGSPEGEIPKGNPDVKMKLTLYMGKVEAVRAVGRLQCKKLSARDSVRQFLRKRTFFGNSKCQ